MSSLISSFLSSSSFFSSSFFSSSFLSSSCFFFFPKIFLVFPINTNSFFSFFSSSFFDSSIISIEDFESFCFGFVFGALVFFKSLFHLFTNFFKFAIDSVVSFLKLKASFISDILLLLN